VVTASTLFAAGGQGPEVDIASGVTRLFSGVDNLATKDVLLVQNDQGEVFGFGLNEPPSYRLTADDDLVGNGEAVNSLAGISRMAFGSNHQVALRSTGQVVTWGDNEVGQLNGASGEPSPVPTAVTGLGQPAFLVDATANVSLAAMQDGTVLSWGTDLTGALGQGDLQARFVAPGQVLTDSGPLTEVVALATCFRTVNALRRDGSVWAWGDDSLGLLGTDSPSRATAAPIPGLPPMRKIVMGFDGAYGLTRTGDVWYWGLTPNQTRQPPVQVSGLAGVLDLQTTGTVQAVVEGQAPAEMGFGQISQ
jgi:alpha-tubulin suppressor-like RCC1 family protein